MNARALLVVAVSAASLALIGWGSRIAYEPADADGALLRLSWRIRPERNEICRDRTPAELEALPVHMRTPRVCETRVTPYQLIIRIDHGRPDTMALLAAGARHDRPIYVLRDSLLSAGKHHIYVNFGRAGASASAMHFDESIDLRPGRISLITMDDEGKKLVLLARRAPFLLDGALHASHNR
jgi:hypothetical protein